MSSTLISNAGLQVGFSTGTLASRFNRGLFYVDTTPGSNGAVSTSGTLQTYGLSRFLSGFTSNASSSIGGAFSVSGVSKLVGLTFTSSTFIAGGLTNSSASSSIFSNAGIILGFGTSTVLKAGLFNIDTSPGRNGNLSTSGTGFFYGLLSGNASLIFNASSTFSGKLNLQAVSVSSSITYVDGTVQKTGSQPIQASLYFVTSSGDSNFYDLGVVWTTSSIRQFGVTLNCEDACKTGNNNVGITFDVFHGINHAISTGTTTLFSATPNANSTTTLQTFCPTGALTCNRNQAWSDNTLDPREHIWMRVTAASGTQMSAIISIEIDNS